MTITAAAATTTTITTTTTTVLDVVVVVMVVVVVVATVAVPTHPIAILIKVVHILVRYAGRCVFVVTIDVDNMAVANGRSLVSIQEARVVCQWRSAQL